MSFTEYRQIPSIYEFSGLAAFDSVRHFVSGRKGGKSEGKYVSLNLSYKVGDKPETVNENRAILAGYLRIEPSKLFFPDQCHTGNVRIISGDDQPADLPETDGLITNEPGICLIVLAADCVPVLMYDPVKKAVAAVHAGWRGTVANIAGNAIRMMQEAFGTNPADLLACIGPSISWKNYEVGDEVRDKFNDLFGDNNIIIRRMPGKEKVHIDLWEANRELLVKNGVPKDNIEIAGICTFAHPEDFFSARRDGIKCGRFATGIMLK